MGDKRGDQQSRAELLGLLLKSTGLQPYMLRHGSGRSLYHLVVLRLDETETRALGEAIGKPLTPIRVGAVRVIALPLEPDAAIGDVDPRYYDAGEGRWTGSITLSRIQ